MSTTLPRDWSGRICSGEMGWSLVVAASSAYPPLQIFSCPVGGACPKLERTGARRWEDGEWLSFLGDASGRFCFISAGEMVASVWQARLASFLDGGGTRSPSNSIASSTRVQDHYLLSLAAVFQPCLGERLV